VRALKAVGDKHGAVAAGRDGLVRCGEAYVHVLVPAHSPQQACVSLCVACVVFLCDKLFHPPKG
jgi:hypothetical protein